MLERHWTGTGMPDDRVEPRVCEICGDEFYRRVYANGRLEKWVRYNNRRWCSVECRNQVKGVWKRRSTKEFRTTDRICRICHEKIVEEWDGDYCCWTSYFHCRKEGCRTKWDELASEEIDPDDIADWITRKRSYTLHH